MPEARGEDLFDLHRFAPLCTIAIAADGREHLAISDGWRRIRLDVVAGTVRQGPVLFSYRLTGQSGLGPKILALRRLSVLCRTGAFSRSLFPIDRRMARWIVALRVWDALQDGASQRDIAIALFGAARVDTEWRGPSDFLKSRVRRLIHTAGALAHGGYRVVLSSN